MDYKYNFVLQDFKNNEIQKTLLKNEIKNSSISANYLKISKIPKVGLNQSAFNPNVYIYFDTELSTPEQTTLTSIVNAHEATIETKFKEMNTTITDRDYDIVYEFDKCLEIGSYHMNWSFLIEILKNNHTVDYQILLDDNVISEHSIKNQICITQRYAIEMTENGFCNFKLQIKCNKKNSSVEVSDISVWFKTNEDM